MSGHTVINMTTDDSDENNNGESDVDSWLDDDTNFITLMIAVSSVVVLCGLCLIIYLCRCPSYDYPENLEKSKKGKKNKKVKRQGETLSPH